VGLFWIVTDGGETPTAHTDRLLQRVMSGAASATAIYRRKVRSVGEITVRWEP
jgi:hypothetical protein